jgi:hypothetical protein
MEACLDTMPGGKFHNASSDMSDKIEHIRTRAYELWEADGRPEGRETDYWHQAEWQLTEGSSSNGANEGEGSPIGARQSNEAATECAQSRPVEAAELGAEPGLATAETPELKKARQPGNSNSDGAGRARKPKAR